VPVKPPPADAAAADTNQRPRPSLGEKPQQTGPEVIGVAHGFRTLGDEVGVQVMQGQASLQLRDRLGAVVLLYPTYRSVEFVLELGAGPGMKPRSVNYGLPCIRSPITPGICPSRIPTSTPAKYWTTGKPSPGSCETWFKIRAQVGQ
jgi:hypothetical protein